MLARLKYYLVNGCVSFTVVLPLYTLLMIPFHEPFENWDVMRALAICAAVQGMLFLTDRLPVRGTWTRLAVNAADVFAMIFLVGMTTGMIPRTWSAAGAALLIGIAAFAVTELVAMIRGQIDAAEINRQIEARRLEKKEETDDEAHP